jgi:hypothetical protein
MFLFVMVSSNFASQILSYLNLYGMSVTAASQFAIIERCFFKSNPITPLFSLLLVEATRPVGIGYGKHTEVSVASIVRISNKW